MASFSTDFAVLNEKAAKLSTFAEDYDAIREQLRQAATSMGSAYDSADNRSYTSHIENFCNDLKFLSDKLRVASDTIRQQASMYKSQEENNTAEANNLP